MRVLIVLPTYNEAGNIVGILTKIRSVLSQATVLVVDDSSPDFTGDLAKKTAEEIGGVEVITRPTKSGLGSAYRDGFTWGLEHGFEAFVEMDSDFSHDPGTLPKLLEPLDKGFDVVVGSRYIPGGSIPDWSWYRRFISKGGNLYASLLLSIPVSDLTSGFRAYTASVIRNIDMSNVKADSYGFQIEMVYKAMLGGGRVTEVPIRFIDRQMGKSKMSMYTVAEALLLVTWWGIVARVGKIARLFYKLSAKESKK